MAYTIVHNNYYYGMEPPKTTPEKTVVANATSVANAIKKKKNYKPKCHVCKKKHRGPCKATTQKKNKIKKKCQVCHKWHFGVCWWQDANHVTGDLRDVLNKQRHKADTPTQITSLMDAMVINPGPVMTPSPNMVIN
ncbi:uncharacterized protein LOC126550907 [Aphis gossypii]|uniref:uncharacterized protein LOC126550907 n=1 Tax=Aphis gossypii TaxID=80765 RepID=UPI002158E86B|nr:uncharacterized protein LOC126550907 [Aphis gossypii]